MRLVLIRCGLMGLLLPLLLTGCGTMPSAMSNADSNTDSMAMSGKVMGGFQPVTGATMNVVEMGTAGYGSTGAILAHVTTDSNGNFSFPSGAYTCPQSNTPMYLLAVGGNAGAGTNASLVLAAGLGGCAAGQSSFVVVNEVTTTALAFALSHFFSTTLGGVNGTTDWFGGPSTTTGGTTTYSKGLVMGNSVTIPAIVSNAVGAPNQAHTGYVVEAQKINTIANILINCVNTTGAQSTTETKTPCGKLFNDTQNGAIIRPSDTLQAAVQMALNPASNVTKLYNLITQTPTYMPFLTAAPNDWSIGVSFTTSNLGLAVDTGTTSTLDIDASGNVWFPSNASGQVGAAYFSPASGTFNGPFNTTGLVHPQQVAIDANGYAWFNDSTAAAVSGYLTTTPTMTQSVSLPGTLSNGITVGGDDRINVGITASSVFEMANISADRSSYAVLSGISFVFPVASLAGDTSDGDGVSISNPTTTQLRDWYVAPGPPATQTQFANANANGAQIIFSGNDNIAVRSYAGNASDGLCIKSVAGCANLQGAPKNAAQGIAIDGGKQLWVASSGDGGVFQIPVNNPSGTDGAVYLNSNGNNNVPNNELLHGSGNGGTATTPYGIGVDAAGNVWVTNAGCTTNDCAPGSFTLTEIVGAGYPTITPVSAQITSGNLVGTEPKN